MTKDKIHGAPKHLIEKIHKERNLVFSVNQIVRKAFGERMQGNLKTTPDGLKLGGDLKLSDIGYLGADSRMGCFQEPHDGSRLAVDERFSVGAAAYSSLYREWTRITTGKERIPEITLYDPQAGFIFGE